MIGVPHDRLGEAVCAFVVGRSPEAPPTPEILADFLLVTGLAKVKVPREWHFLAALPTTASGKVQKHILRGQVGSH